MDLISDGAKKERRNLLGAGFVGIIVAQLKIYPTEIDLVGLKFQSPELPFIAIGGLCAAITYFLIKFCSSYLYEQYFNTRAALAAQISEGSLSLDIVREEEGLEIQGRGLVERQKVFQGQQVNAEKRIKALQEKIDQEDIAHELSLKITDQKISVFQQVLTKESGEYIRTPGDVLTARGNIEKQVRVLEEGRTSYLQNRETKRQQDNENLENEKNNWKELREALEKGLATDQNGFAEKRRKIMEWKQVHKRFGRVSPLHRSLEIHLPLLVGVVAIGSLIYLMVHFPPPPKPPSLPEF
jgi:hypothetical protein